MNRLGVAFNDDIPLQESIEYLILAEKLGYESVWVYDDYYYRDAITRMAYFASKTEKIRLASGVINPYTRSPPLIAMSMAALDEMSGGRAILGIGPSLRLWLYEKNRGKVNHMKVMRECVEIFRQLIDGRTVNYRGEYFYLNNVKLGFKAVRSRIPVYLGVMGPRMLQLAGEIADGVILTAGATAEYAAYASENIRMGAEKAGRNPSEVDLASLIMTSVSDEDGGDKASLKTR